MLSLSRVGGKDRVVPVAVKRIGSQPHGVQEVATVRPEGYGFLSHDHTLVATHRPARPGQRRTLSAHLPPEKVHFLMQTPAWCRAQAAEIGTACAQFIDALLGDRPLDCLRGAQGVLRLAKRYGVARLDAACARAHAVGEYRYHTVKTILVHAHQQPLPELAPVAAVASGPPPRHARPWTTFFPDPESEEVHPGIQWVAGTEVVSRVGDS